MQRGSRQCDGSHSSHTVFHCSREIHLS